MQSIVSSWTVSRSMWQNPRCIDSTSLFQQKEKHTWQFGFSMATSEAQAPVPKPHSRTRRSLETGGKIKRLSNIVWKASWEMLSRSISSCIGKYSVCRPAETQSRRLELTTLPPFSTDGYRGGKRILPRLPESNRRCFRENIVDSLSHGKK